MITIQRQGVASAVVRVPVADLTTVGTEQQAAEAKTLAVQFLSVNSPWRGAVTASRANLHNSLKFYSVIVRHVQTKAGK